MHPQPRDSNYEIQYEPPNVVPRLNPSEQEWAWKQIRWAVAHGTDLPDRIKTANPTPIGYSAPAIV